MKVKTFVALMFLLVLVPSIKSHSQSSQELRVVTDETTGVKIGLPSFLTEEHTTHWGRNWSTYDRSFQVDTLTYQSNYSLRSLYNRLRGIKGRTLTNDKLTQSTFVLAGAIPTAAIFMSKRAKRTVRSTAFRSSILKSTKSMRQA